MLNLSAILNFYESKKNGNCMYVEKYGSLTGLKCQHKTVSLFCEEHEYKGMDEKKAVQFLLQLTENPEMLNEILKNISYYSFHHKEEGRLCEEINCTDCDHDDREFECKADNYNRFMRNFHKCTRVSTFFDLSNFSASFDFSN